MPEEKKTNSFLQKLKEKAANNKTYLGDVKPDEASMVAATCPNCGAGRAKQDGVTHCAYCDFEFIGTKLSEGIFVSKEDNSKT
jgi:uncharacterized Zn finger protein (UPF0148 family)